jgi:glycosyltransferase involved in cell wall biosynthesis
MTPGGQYRILHAVGPGDAVEAYRKWRAGESVVSETARTYSGEFFSFCAANGIEAWVVSSHPRAERIVDGPFIVENRPKPGRAGAHGLAYHFQQLRYALSLAGSAHAYRPHLALIDSGTTHWFLAAIFRALGSAVVPNLHNSRWPAGFPATSLTGRIMLRLDALFFRFVAAAGMGVSPECERQARQLGGQSMPFFQFRGQYERDDFRDWRPADPGQRPFRVLFAGRAERNKGVCDVVEIARRLELKHPGQFAFDICGTGSAEEHLRSVVQEHGLEGLVTLHGRLDRPALLERYRRSHLVIVPTRSDFVEGLALVAAEAVLMGRPVLSNPVVPACEVLGDAAIVARTDDVADYVEKLERLATDRERYQKAVAACPAAAAQFIDRTHSLESALCRLLAALRPGKASRNLRSSLRS